MYLYGALCAIPIIWSPNIRYTTAISYHHYTLFNERTHGFHACRLIFSVSPSKNLIHCDVSTNAADTILQKRCTRYRFQPIAIDYRHRPVLNAACIDETDFRRATYAFYRWTEYAMYSMQSIIEYSSHCYFHCDFSSSNHNCDCYF